MAMLHQAVCVAGLVSVDGCNRITYVKAVKMDDVVLINLRARRQVIRQKSADPSPGMSFKEAGNFLEFIPGFAPISRPFGRCP
jgi:hypothetical protein